MTFPPPPKPPVDEKALERWLLAVGVWGAAMEKRVQAAEAALEEVPEAAADGTALHSFMHAGGSGWSSWRLAGSQDIQGAIGTAITVNFLRAVPIVAPRAQVNATSIGWEVTTGGAGNGRIGLYTNKGDDNLYPDQLLVDSGSISLTPAAVKSVTGLTIALTPGQLYWLVHVHDTARATRCLTAPTDVLGHANDATGNQYVQLRVAFTYGALPQTFPAGAAPDPNTATTDTSVPALYLKVAA